MTFNSEEEGILPPEDEEMKDAWLELQDLIDNIREDGREGILDVDYVVSRDLLRYLIHVNTLWCEDKEKAGDVFIVKNEVRENKT